MAARQTAPPTPARALTNALNPFFIFTALYTLVALARSASPEALLYVAIELLAAGTVAGYVLLMRRRSRVSDFWISARTQRLVPSLFLLGAFVGLLAALALLGAPKTLLLTTLSMGLGATTVAAITLFWKASAHCAVAGHAAMAGPLLLGSAGTVFVLVLPLVLYARISPGAHTVAQAIAGAALGAAFAFVFLN